ncbi:hypothetical protein FRB90_009328 [Tulasnella sp. 427]|nr:hypothetical protein FRB90_009328 [Tulasnella sp. 427]
MQVIERRIALTTALPPSQTMPAIETSSIGSSKGFVERPVEVVQNSIVRNINLQGSAPPIHRLPFEILLKVVQTYIGGCSKPILALIMLAQVCKRWRELIDEPQLWRRINASEGPKPLRMALEKAKGSPLDLTFNEQTAPWGLKNFFTEIGSRMEQWNSLVVEATWLPMLCSPLETAVPQNLRRLHLHEFPHWVDDTMVMTLFGGLPAPPSLQDVSFSIIDVRFSQLCLAGLTSLELHTVSGLSDEHFIQILQNSPYLRLLRLSALPLKFSGADDRALQVPPIHLASLVELSLTSLFSEVIHLALSIIDAPGVQKLEIVADMHDGRIPLSALLSAVQRLVTPLSGIISSAKEVEVSFASRNQLKICIGTFALGLSYIPDEAQPSFRYFLKCVEWLQSHFGDRVVEFPYHLKLRWELPTSDCLQWFTTAVKVTKLTLECSEGAMYTHGPMVDILQLLSHRSSSSRPIWYLPHMKMISLDSTTGENRITPHVLELLKGRLSARPSEDEVPGPVPFREIRFLNFGQEDFTTPNDYVLTWLLDVEKHQRLELELMEAALIDTDNPSHSSSALKMGFEEPPVHRIPYEILLDIIQTLIKATPKRIETLHALSQVCRRWRIVVEEAHFLWVDIDASAGKHLLQEALKRTEELPLDIKYHQKSARIGQLELFEIIGSRVGQWRSLVVQADHLTGLCPSLETLIPDKLFKLHLTKNPSSPGINRVLTLFGGAPAPPSLRDVSFSNIDIRLNPLRLSRLISLKLQNVNEYSDWALVQALRDSPGLETLHLVDMDFDYAGSDYSDEEPPVLEPIQLPFLLDLSMINSAFDSIPFILSAVDAPLLKTFHFRTEIPNYQPSMAKVLKAGAERSVNSLRSLVAEAKEATITVGKEGLHILLGGLNVEFEISDGLEYLMDNFEWLCSDVGDHIGDLPYHLHLHHYHPPHKCLRWFTSTVKTTKLTITNPKTAARNGRATEMINALSHPDYSLSGWLLPYLEIISVKVHDAGGSFTPSVQVMAENRLSASRGQGEGPIPPVPLREIRLSPFRQEGHDLFREIHTFIAQVQEASGGADVYWKGQKWTSRLEESIST